MHNWLATNLLYQFGQGAFLCPRTELNCLRLIFSQKCIPVILQGHYVLTTGFEPVTHRATTDYSTAELCQDNFSFAVNTKKFYI